MKKNVVILDEQPIFREGLKTLLNSTKEFEVIAELGEESQALDTLPNLFADIIIISYNLINIYSELKSKGYKNSFLIVSETKSKENYLTAFQLNASGFIFKECEPSELLHAINKIIKGETYFTSDVSNYLIQNLYVKNKAAKKYKENNLTRRERQIIELIKEGYSSKKIAEILFLSSRTVDKHRSNIMSKYNVHSIVELINYDKKNNTDAEVLVE